MGRPVLELGARQRWSARTGRPVPSLGQSIETPYWHLSHTGTGASMGRPILALILQLHQRNSDQIVAHFDTIKHGSLIGQYICEKVWMVCSGPHAIGRFLHRTTISKAYLCLMFCFLNWSWLLLPTKLHSELLFTRSMDWLVLVCPEPCTIGQFLWCTHYWYGTCMVVILVRLIVFFAVPIRGLINPRSSLFKLTTRAISRVT
jgi:hypothetical protein